MLVDRLFETNNYKTSKRFQPIQEENNECDLEANAHCMKPFP